MMRQNLKLIAWIITAAAAIVAIVAWGQGLSWQFGSLSLYQIFPLFGLLGFSLMWSHYIASAIRQYAGTPKSVLSQYFEITSYVVLAAILLHPGLLIWQLWRDGLGLPPESYLSYVGPAKFWFVILASISFLAFIAYEFRRLYQGRPWWKWVALASDLAMIGIFFHALALGTQTQSGWFRMVWFFYGLTLAGSLGYTYYRKYNQITSMGR